MSIETETESGGYLRPWELATPMASCLVRWRRMRDSNPRGREPNPLSKSALVRSPPSLSVRSRVDRRRFVADERQRTFPTETRTETTLMIKLPMVTRPANAERLGVEDGVRTRRCLGSVHQRR